MQRAGLGKLPGPCPYKKQGGLSLTGAEQSGIVTQPVHVGLLQTPWSCCLASSACIALPLPLPKAHPHRTA
jgi:hypothetical protein